MHHKLVKNFLGSGIAKSALAHHGRGSRMVSVVNDALQKLLQSCANSDKNLNILQGNPTFLLHMLFIYHSSYRYHKILALWHWRGPSHIGQEGLFRSGTQICCMPFHLMSGVFYLAHAFNLGSLYLLYCWSLRMASGWLWLNTSPHYGKWGGFRWLG